MRKLYKADGTEQDLPKQDIEAIRKLIGAEMLDTVVLADRKHVMIVDDLGHAKQLPLNKVGTDLYLAKCIPGTDWTIVGDVVVVPDEDFGDD